MPPARVVLWVTSLGGMAVLARSLWLGPPPLLLAGLGLAAYIGVVAAGIALPQLQMFGDVVWRGRPGRNRVALTFDDGPHPVTTRAVLGILAERDKTATFFVVGKKAMLFPDVVREIHAAGHTLGIHGYSHPWLYSFLSPASVARDIARAQDAVEAAVGIRPLLFRPPIGRVSPRVAAGASRAGVTIVAWTVRALDGVQMTQADDVVRRVSRRLKDGAIVLLHDASEKDDFEPASVKSLARLLDEIDRRGMGTVGADAFVSEA